MRRHLGITMIELLVSVAIIGLLIVAMTIGIRSYLLRSSDAERKSDLKKISQALEQYYNDHNGYPATLDGNPASSLISCGTNAVLNPYMKDVPCDPNGGAARPYLYIPTTTTRVGSRGETLPTGYRLLTALQYTPDPQIEDVGCPGANGCGGIPGTVAVPDKTIYNFGIATNTQLIQP
jgi:type II secretory pathway pseudopilin PulG